MEFRKALIVDSIDCVYWGLRQSLGQVFTFNLEHVPYGYEAISQLQKRNKTSTQYDLLILELGPNDGLYKTLSGFHYTLSQLRKYAPGIRIIGHSSERRPFALLDFLHESALDACVLKGPNGTQEMIKAIKNLGNFESFVSPEILKILNEVPPHYPDHYDKSILTELSKGNSQKEIADLFSKTGISPSSLSSIEKRINLLKDRLKAHNNVHLISRAHELGIINII